MNKKNLYVVEGKDDIAKLTSLGCHFVIQSEGYLVSSCFLSFLKEAVKVRPVVIVTDPDGPGRKIADKISVALQGQAKILILDKRKASGHGKIGVTETDADYLRGILSPYLKEDEEAKEEDSVSMADLSDLGLAGGEAKMKREAVIRTFSLIPGSVKSLLKQMNILSLTTKKIKDGAKS